MTTKENRQLSVQRNGERLPAVVQGNGTPAATQPPASELSTVLGNSNAASTDLMETIGQIFAAAGGEFKGKETITIEM